MTQEFNNYYNLLTDLSGSNEDLQFVLNDVNAKYNNSIWRSFTTVLPASLSKKFTTIVEETGIIVKASVVGAESKKPLRSIEGIRDYSDSLHKIGHGFRFTQGDITAIEELNLANTDIATMVARRYYNRVNTLIGGFHATWNGWIFNALATQTILLPNLGGSTTTIDLHTKATNKVKCKGDKGWFESGTTAKIADDLVRMNKLADDQNMPAQRAYVCSKTLYDKIMADAGIIAAVKAYLPVLDTTNLYLSPSRVASYIPMVFDIPPIVPIDEKSRYEVDGVPTLASADFDVNKISLIPTAYPIFNMHNSPSDYSKDTNPATYKAIAEGGLIGTIQLFESDPMAMVTNAESWSFPTFKNPDNIISLDSTQHSTTGA